MKLNDTSIQTIDGFFDYEDPKNSDFSLEGIGYALSNICRWGGHCKPFFSVAQHAVFVADIAYDIAGGDAEAGLYGLHHDDHEVFNGDTPSPRKVYLRRHQRYYEKERRETEAAVFAKLGLSFPMPERIREIVHEADYIALGTERAFLLPSGYEWPNGFPPQWKFNRFKKYLLDKDWIEEYVNKHKEFLDELSTENLNRLPDFITNGFGDNGGAS